jgi:predicted Rossmann fold nucleotide-binding protein DprA/Smf involved in DNA uptake
MPDGDAFLAAVILIERALGQFRERIELTGGCVVSGGADGVDSWACKTAGASFGWFVANGKFVEHLPDNARWEPDGFKARNELVAADCTHLLRVYRPDSKTYGSGWTADRAEALGKIVRRFVWSPAERRFVRIDRNARTS